MPNYKDDAALWPDEYQDALSEDELIQKEEEMDTDLNEELSDDQYEDLPEWMEDDFPGHAGRRTSPAGARQGNSRRTSAADTRTGSGRRSSDARSEESGRDPEYDHYQFARGYEEGLRDAYASMGLDLGKHGGRRTSPAQQPTHKDQNRDYGGRQTTSAQQPAHKKPHNSHNGGQGNNKVDADKFRDADVWIDDLEKETEGKKKRKDTKAGRRRSRVPVVIAVIVLIVMIPFLWLVKQLQTIQAGSLDLADLKEYISKEVQQSMGSGAMAGYQNIALFGVDSTQGSLESGNNRSDIMVICSINKRSGDIKLVSLYRDTWLNIGNDNYQKANAAYAYGGPERAIQMLNTNLDMNITDYATVGFEGIARIIDTVGGVTIDVQEDEIEHLNNYQLTMSEETGMEYVPVTAAGPQTLTGLQATAYCRIRYTAGEDFRRTERQREVLSRTFTQMKKHPLSVLRNMSTLLSGVRTSLSTVEILALGIQSLRFHMDKETTGIPIQELRTTGYIGDQAAVIPVTLEKNVVWLHEYLFGDKDYTPSDSVQQISQTISGISGYY